MERTAFYAGSFDPFTKGHLAIVAQASMMFDHVIVGVGVNPDKKSLLTEQQKLNAIQYSLYDLASMYSHRALIGRDFSTAEAYLAQNLKKVSVISYRGLSVDAAVEYGASVLIRGERLVGDHDAEMQLAHVNGELIKIRGYSLQTVQIPVPDVALTYVSSTVVRQLLDMGEYITAMNYVMPSVHNMLIEQFLRQKYGLLTNCVNYGVHDLFNAYRTRKYHNFSHIAYMLNFMDIFIRATGVKVDKSAMQLAIFWHDFYQGQSAEETSVVTQSAVKAKVAARACNILPDIVYELVLATEHNLAGEQKLTNVGEIIHDLDLAVLSYDYGIYAWQVRCEYKKKISYERYVENRIAFLDKFLAMPRIYQTEYFYDRFEDVARENLRRERYFWKAKNL